MKGFQICGDFSPTSENVIPVELFTLNNFPLERKGKGSGKKKQN